MQDQPRPWVSLRSGELTAAIDPRGAQLSILKDRAGRDLLWGGDPGVWAGRAPLLFPIVGVLAGGAYRLGTQSYRLPRHGFARDMPFAIETTSSSSVLLRLRADEATLRVYPFRFELDVHLELIGPTLTFTSSVRNCGNEELPASFGYHPAFRWPLPFGHIRSSHFVEFELEETAPVRRIDAAGLLMPQRHLTPVAQRRLALTDALFQDDVVIFDSLQSRSAVYGSKDGPRIRVSFPDARYLGIWTKPGAQFICIEPWHGVTDPQGFSGDFTEKPGVFILPPNGVFTTTMAMTLLE